MSTMNKNSSTSSYASSMKRLVLILGLLTLLVSTEFATPVHGRALRSTAADNNVDGTVAGCEEQGGAGQDQQVAVSSRRVFSASGTFQNNKLSQLTTRVEMSYHIAQALSHHTSWEFI
ncbi:hypothetical protein CCACVL1_14074 [Corchorus capsularis]|uniref:Uncharacterized protein n=1 Tax=Corchorus capsularis TaxID=210143 RepID=A0A1R3I8F3_COCAP|nr:hypothetical protein CCACVL1_14074 [Corchorus capsularis]